MINAEETKRNKAKNLRYTKPIVRNINLDTITQELWDIQEECYGVAWYFDGEDDTLINALDGNEDEAYEFKMMFSDLCAECDQMQEDLQNEYVPDCFDGLFVAAGGGKYGGGLLGWDSYEQDYYGISLCESEWAENTAKERMCRMTKNELIDATRACLKVLYAYIGLKNRYDNLKASLDILRDENTAHLQIVKQIESLYDAASEKDFASWADKTRRFEEMFQYLPQESWVA